MKYKNLGNSDIRHLNTLDKQALIMLIDNLIGQQNELEMTIEMIKSCENCNKQDYCSAKSEEACEKWDSYKVAPQG